MRNLSVRAAVLCGAALPLLDLPAQSTPAYVDLTAIGGHVWHAAAFQPTQGSLLVYGEGETWEWDGQQWSERRPQQAPPTRARHAMVHDAARDRVLLFGGGDRNTWRFSDETWEWDGAEWRRLLPPTSPSAREGHAMAYDPARQRTVLFGGFSGGFTGSDETWEWDGSDWHRSQPSHNPPGRGYASMVHDPAHGVTMLYGGVNYIGGDANPLGDAWQWDGTDWTPLPTTGLPNFIDATLVYEPTLRSVVLFGIGYDDLETWRWDGAVWSPLGSGSLAGRYHVSVVYDSTRSEVVLYGGSSLPGLWTYGNCGDQLAPRRPAETWAWRPTGWELRDGGGGHRGGPGAIAYDTRRAVAVSLSKPQRGCLGTWTSLTAEWDGRRWTSIAEGDLPPQADHSMTYDSTRDEVVLFGGSSTWKWDGSSWQLQRPATTPTFRVEAAMVDDPARGEVILFGGDQAPGFGPSPTDETWRWNGSDWRQLHPMHAPSPRLGAAMAFDPRRGVLVLHGGSDADFRMLDDTWEWDGTDWTRIAASGIPAATRHGLCWDPSRDRIVGYVDDRLYGYDGAAWTYIQTAHPLPAANGGALVFDTERQALVVFGNGITRLLGDVAEATVRTMGHGCPGTNGEPQLRASSPRLGSGSLQFSVEHARTGAGVLLGVTGTQQSISLGAGCTSFLGGSIAWFQASANPAGLAILPVPLPFDVSLRGVPVWAQAAVLDPQGASLGLALTPALRLDIGD